MMCDVKGKITFVEKKVTKDNQPYNVVKVMQADKVGNVETVAVRIFAPDLIAKGFEVGKDIVFTDIKVKAYKSGADRAGLSVDKW